ncbi:potassium voltage-gated channel subfamily KQT member 1-like [Athalia rosae]|uniref:potassium voltage-gated channel subfamily KQT member 1-like n=1 Tax=Athalia rosae TaxID=37344 RepID=UPI000626372D|nr:potassium voltage-gated channel subfamily KQT member 1-like [Athalia rosae]
MRNHSRHHEHHHGQAMPLEEVQGLLPPTSRTGNRGPLSVTIVQVGGNGGNVGSSGLGNAGGCGGGGTGDLLGLEPPSSDLKPAASPLSDISALHSDNNDTYTGGLDPRLLLGGISGGDRLAWEGRYQIKEHRRAGKATFQGQVYNFLERPTGWKCFVYHCSV